MFPTWRKFTFDSAVQGYHLYKNVWKPAIGEKLHAEQEPDNAVDKLAMKVVKKQQNSRPFSLRVPANLHMAERCVEVSGCGGMELLCMLVFSCLSKAKIKRL